MKSKCLTCKDFGFVLKADESMMGIIDHGSNLCLPGWALIGEKIDSKHWINVRAVPPCEKCTSVQRG